jgi:hypothetical protein
VATLGACLAAVRAATLAELAEAFSVPVHDVRLTLRRLAEQLEPAGMRVLEPGTRFSIGARFKGLIVDLCSGQTVVESPEWLWRFDVS